MWNYRIVRTIQGNEPLCRMREVYYDKKNRPWSHCEISIQGESLEDCIKDVAWIMVGITKPVLEYPKDFNKR